MMPAGRPTRYEDQHCKGVIEAARKGFSLTAFAGEIGVARSTINKWMEQHPEFSEAVNVAKAVRALWWESQAHGAIDGSVQGRAAGTLIIFGLKNVAPDDWIDAKTLDNTSSDGSVAPTTINLVAPASLSE